MHVHIGIDDTDSPDGLCTTYIGFLLSVRFKKLGFSFVDLPYLVRLNPNVPFKTRGNAAVSIHLDASESRVEEIRNVVEDTLSVNVMAHAKTSPGFAIVVGDVNENLKKLYLRALSEVVPLSYVKEQVEKGLYGDVEVGGLGKGRGIVGALAAVGAYPLSIYTYELLVYRDPSERETKRLIDKSILIEIDRKYRPIVFTSYDYSEKRALAIPRGPDPVILGIRSLDVKPLQEILSFYLHRIDGLQKVVGYALYKTNQATNAHLTIKKSAEKIRPYDSVVMEGVVVEAPVILEGGHVGLKICDTERCVEAMFYRETGRLNRVARLLRPGDRVEIGGGAVPRKGLTLNVEYLRVLSVHKQVVYMNPLCPRCGARMKSAGTGKGYKCPKCGYRSKSFSKIQRELPRILEPGLYVSSARAYRHLTKPREIEGLNSIPYEKSLLEGDFVFLSKEMY